ncbi:MFS transporter [Haloarchaeobius amylolyticus]|uniref:MFS transporter n=1 Tax=Haloarchaeobius amylolyticus TaxID=1198296 RepID=UPI00226EA80E|nr:MFS transporter [Haloarchaeobius amylolyticus]
MTDVRPLVRRFYLYYLTNSYGLYLPVSVLYLLEVRQFGLAEIGAIKAVFSFALVAAEIPTGYLGDRIGRRASLALGNGLSALSLVAYVFVDTPVEYMLLNVVWATGWAFRSGTVDAWLYELLASRGAADDFARYRGRASTVLLVVSAGTALLSGVLATVDWTIPFFANAALAASGIPLLLTLPATADAAVEADSADADEAPEDAPENAPDDELFTVRDAVWTLRLQLGRPSVRWFLVYAALFAGLFGLTRSFEQPAAAAVGVPLPAFGALYAAFKLVSAGVAASTGWFEDHLGVAGVFLLVAPVVGVFYAGALVLPVLVVPVLFLNRAVHTILQPVRNQYLNDRLTDVGRATVLSGASMALSLASGLAKLGGGAVAEGTGAVRTIALAGVVVALGAGVLWVAVSPVRSASGAGSVGEKRPSVAD